jgi:hypothetical protein
MSIKSIVGVVLFLVVAAIGLAVILIDGRAPDAATIDNVKEKVDLLFSETGRKIPVAEEKVLSFQKHLAGLNGNLTRGEFRLEAIDESLATNEKGIKEEEFRLRKIKEYCEKGKPVLHPIDGHTLSDAEVAAQVEMSITRLNAFCASAAGLKKQREAVNATLEGFRRDMLHGPAQLVELQSALECLKMQYAFHRDHLKLIDQTGSPVNLTSAYRDAKAAIVDATCRFETIAPSSSFVQVEFPDEETPMGRSTKNIDKINAALGINPPVVVAESGLAAD